MALTKLLRHEPDTPRSAYALLPRRVTTAIVTSLALVAALGWAYTIRQADRWRAWGRASVRWGAG